MKIIKFAVMISAVSLFMTFPSFANITNQTGLNYQSVQNLLQDTEEIGTQNPQKFDQNLNILKQNLHLFNAHQRDYFKYLTYYQQGYNGEFTHALQNFINLFNESKFIDIKFRAKSKISNINIISGDIPEAINGLDYVLNNIDIVKQKHLKQEGYQIASTIYFLLNEHETSENFSNLMLKNQPTQSEYCKAVTNIARIKLKKKTQINNEDQLYVEDAINSCEEIGDYVFSNLLKMQWLKHRLNVSKQKHDYLEVLETLKNTESQVERTHYKNLINIKNALFTQTYWKLNQQEKAIQYAKKTLKQGESIGGNIQEIEVLQILIDYYKTKGDSKSAFEYLSQKNQAEKQYYDQEQAKIMAYQTATHNSLAKSHEIELLNKKNQLLSLEKNLSQKSALNQKLLIVFLIIITTFILLWGFKNKKNQKIYKHLSETDDLTTVFNRKGLKDFVESLLHSSEKIDRPVSYGIFDLDKFKAINDQFGHITGDWVIIKVIETCQSISGDNIKFGRIGGEEFAIVMIGAESDKLAEHAEQCRIKIAAINTQETGYKFNISASFGITSTCVSGYDFDQLMKNADQAMYNAKIAGRNMVVDYCSNYIN